MSDMAGLTGFAKSFAGQLARRWDSWENRLTSLGTTRDKRTAGSFMPGAIIQPQDLEELYHGDDMAARAVGKVVEEAMRKGVELQSSDDDTARAKDDIALVQEALDAIGFVDALTEAAEWGRLFGGGVILLGAEGAGDPAMPMVDERVRAMRYLTVLDRRDLLAVRYYDDPLSPKYGKPMLYAVRPITESAMSTGTPEVIVHETRMIVFEGVRTSKRKKRENAGWSHSVLQRIFEILRDANANWASVSHLMTDANQGVYSLKGFLDIIQSGDLTDFDTRMTAIEKSRSSVNAMVVDADMEKFERQATSFTGLPEMLDRTWQRLAAAADMPVTKLMGMSPAGLNATGQSDENSWYDSVASYQQKTLQRPAQRIVRLVAQSLGVRNPENLTVSFPPLKQMTAGEQADIRLKTAQSDASNIDKGIYIAEEITLARSKNGKFSADEPVVDLDVRRAALEKELEQMEEQAGQPDPNPLMAHGAAGGDDVTPPVVGKPAASAPPVAGK